MIVAKFGGSSVASKQNAENIKNIIQSNSNIMFVVVSAIGKSKKYAQKVTDLLYKVNHLYKTGGDYEKVVDDIIGRYFDLAQQLNVVLNLFKEKQKLLSRLRAKTASKEYIVSRGEYLSAKLYAKFLQGQFLDASDYIIFKSNNELNFYQTAKRLKSLPKDKLYIIGGFYGASSNGKTRIFSRGGSDITGAVIAKVLNAEVYENYTDVDGVFDKNPRVFGNAKQLPILSYKTAYGMADAGNEIVHKTALKLLKNSKTVLIVKNTINNAFGTVVTSADYILPNLFVCKQNVTVLKLLNLSQEQIKRLCTFGQIKQIVKHGIYFFVMFEQIYIKVEELNNLFGLTEICRCVKYSFFSNIKISVKNIKKIAKIAKKFKKYAIFSGFLSNENNFVVLIKNQNQDKTLSILNKYLQD